MEKELTRDWIVHRIGVKVWTVFKCVSWEFYRFVDSDYSSRWHNDF